MNGRRSRLVSSSGCGSSRCSYAMSTAVPTCSPTASCRAASLSRLHGTPPLGFRNRGTEPRTHPRRRHVGDLVPRPPRRVPGARGQRAGSRLVAPTSSKTAAPWHVHLPGAVRQPPHSPGSQLLPATSSGTAGRGAAERRAGADRGRAHAGRAQFGVLRAFVPRPPDGSGAFDRGRDIVTAVTTSSSCAPPPGSVASTSSTGGSGRRVPRRCSSASSHSSAARGS